MPPDAHGCAVGRLPFFGIDSHRLCTGYRFLGTYMLEGTASAMLPEMSRMITTFGAIPAANGSCSAAAAGAPSRDASCVPSRTEAVSALIDVSLRDRAVYGAGVDRALGAPWASPQAGECIGVEDVSRRVVSRATADGVTGDALGARETARVRRRVEDLIGVSAADRRAG